MDAGTSEQARTLLSPPIPLPPLNYQTLDGQPMRVLGQSGGPLLLNLWASWCVPCVTELSELVERRGELAAAGVEVVALSVDGVGDDRSDAQSARNLLERYGENFTFTAGVANADLLDILQNVHNHLFDRHVPLPLPTSFLINEHGQLAAVYKGPLKIDDLFFDVDRMRLDEVALRDASVPLSGRWLAPPRGTQLVRFADQLVKNGQLDAAGDFLLRNQSQLAAEPKYTETLLFVGDTFLEQENHQAALALYRQAVQVKPNLAKANYQLGLVLEMSGELEQAMAQYRRVLEMNPSNADAHLRLGFVLNQQGKIDDAIASFREGVRLRPNFVAAHFDFGLILERAGKPAEALAQFRRVLEIAADFSDAHFRMAVLLQVQGDPAAAVPHLRERIRLTPADLKAQNNLAWILAIHPDPQVRNGAEALPLAEHICQATQHRHPLTLTTLAAAQAEVGRYEEAVTTAKKALDLARTAKSNKLATQIERHLRLYEDGKPYRGE